MKDPVNPNFDIAIVAVLRDRKIVDFYCMGVAAVFCCTFVSQYFTHHLCKAEWLDCWKALDRWSPDERL